MTQGNDPRADLLPTEDKPIRSFDEFGQRYFPQEHERELMRTMSPYEYGKRIAQRAFLETKTR